MIPSQRSTGKVAYGCCIQCRREVPVTPAIAVEVTKNVRLDVKLLRCCLYYKIARRELRAIYHRLNALQSRVSLLRRDLAFGQLTLQVLANRSQGAVKKLLFDVAQNYVVSAAGEYVGDAVAHRTGPDHSYAMYFHDALLNLENLKV